jgi:hypothetical protein
MSLSAIILGILSLLSLIMTWIMVRVFHKTYIQRIELMKRLQATDDMLHGNESMMVWMYRGLSVFQCALLFALYLILL